MTDDDERPPMREMRSAECWERIAQAPYGRVGTVAAGEMDIFPVNQAWIGTASCFAPHQARSSWP
jgi:hypothetical protein